MSWGSKRRGAMRMRRHAHGLLSLALMQLACGAPGSAPRASTPLLPVPSLDLTAVDEAVRAQIDEHLLRLERARADTRTPATTLAEAYGELARVLLAYTLYEPAEPCLLNAQRLDPDTETWLHLLGYVYQTQGRNADAIQAFARAVALTPDNVASLVRLAGVHLADGDLDAAQMQYTRALTLAPDTAAAHDGLGQVALERDDPAVAIPHFTRALEFDPAASGLHHALGRAFRALGDRERAREHFDRGGLTAVRFTDPAVDALTRLGRSVVFYSTQGSMALNQGRPLVAAASFREAVDLDRHDHTVRHRLAMTLVHLGDVDGALNVLDAIPATPVGDAAARAELLALQATLQLQHRGDREALPTLHALHALTPDDPRARQRLASALVRSGQLEPALLQYDALLTTPSSSPDLLVQRAFVHLNLGHRGRALADLERARQLRPDDPVLLLRYADALEHLGDPDAARVARARADDQATTPQARARLATTRAAQHLRRGEIIEGVAQARRAAELDPQQPQLHLALGNALARAQRHGEAADAYARTLALDPNQRRARHGEAVALVRAGRLAEARQRLALGLQHLPRDRAMAHALARLLAAAPAPYLRDAAVALRLARQLHEDDASDAAVATLAMAHAAAGSWDDAQMLQRTLGSENSDSAGAALQAQRLAAYRQQQPWQIQHPDEITQILAVAP